MYSYAWDLAEEGLDLALGRMRDAGINTVTLAASYHAGKFLRPHGPGGKIYFPEDGTVYFRPRPTRYGIIKPLQSALAKERDMFAELEKSAPDMQRIAWTVCAHNTALGTRHPEFAAQNAYGDRYPYSLSPAFPEVQDYIVALCADMAAHYELHGVTLESPGFLPFDHGFHHEFFLAPLNGWAKWLLGLDFSEGVMTGAREAGIDVERLRVKVCAALDEFLQAPTAMSEGMAGAWITSDIVGDAEWGAFLRWRCGVVSDLIRRVRAELPKQTTLAVIPSVQRPTANCWMEGSDLDALAKAADALEIPAYEPSAAAALNDAQDSRRRAGADAKLNFILRPAYPDLSNGAETAETARALQNVGLNGIAFYNYGHFALDAMNNVRDALAQLDS
jgi:hypothetical protein